jgi:hypothetical protein
MGILDMIRRLFVNFATWIGTTATQREQMPIRRSAGANDPRLKCHAVKIVRKATSIASAS